MPCISLQEFRSLPSATQRLTPRDKLDVMVAGVRINSADLLLGRGAMRDSRTDHSKIIKPKKKINAKVKIVRIPADLKLSHWYEKASLSISGSASRSFEF